MIAAAVDRWHLGAFIESRGFEPGTFEVAWSRLPRGRSLTGGLRGINVTRFVQQLGKKFLLRDVC